jgi:hypothetical protein
LLLSLLFHLAVIALLLWVAAREGWIVLPLRTISVSLLLQPPPAEPPPRKTPASEPPAKPFDSLSQPLQPSVSPEPAPQPEKLPSAIPQHVFRQPRLELPAPAPAELPAFAFGGAGTTAQTRSDPAALYRSYVEFSLRSRWNRPEDIADEHYVAEIEIAVDSAGRISNRGWKLKSGDVRWDASVMKVITQTRTLDRPPPPGFPAKLTIRFDVVPSGELPAE